MASLKSFFLSKPNYIYPTTDSNDLEFDESDLWNLGLPNEITPTESKKQQSLPINLRSAKKHSTRGSSGAEIHRSGSSVPLNIPDWSKILKGEYKEQGKGEIVDDDESGDGVDQGEGRIPPHEYLARRRGASFSVQEGIGRTLKGRDLRRVRNAILKKTGFMD